jgi:hypothetical protein
MRLLEAVGIKDAPRAACWLHHEYISDRSVALLLRSDPDTLEIGSGTCFKIGRRYLIATVAHNVSDFDLSQIEVVPRGAYYSDKLVLAAKNHIQTLQESEVDLAWIEVEANSFERSPSLDAFSLEQTAPRYPEEVVTPCFLQGYPSGKVELVESKASVKPSVESDGLLTLSIPPSARGVRHQHGIDWAIEYPPHDESVDHLPLAAPPGNSGGGIWLIPNFEDGKLWLPGDVKLLAIVRKWYKPSKEVWGTRVDLWLKLISEDFPELRGDVERLLEATTSVPNTGARADG